MIIFTKDFWFLSLITPVIIMGILVAVDLFGNSQSESNGILDWFKQRLKITGILIAILVVSSAICSIIPPLKRKLLSVLPVLEFPLSVYAIWLILVILIGAVIIGILFYRNYKKALDKANTEEDDIEFEPEIEIPETMKKGCPPLSLMKDYPKLAQSKDSTELREQLENCLDSYELLSGISFRGTKAGPSVYRLIYRLEAGTRITEYTKYSREIAMSLGFENVNIKGGKEGLVFELPNMSAPTIHAKHIFAQQTLENGDALKSSLNIGVGHDAVGELFNINIAEAPHLLVAGATGGGKSIFMNVLIVGIILKNSPKDVQIIMIDPKMVEFTAYNKLPHLIFPVITEPLEATRKLEWAVEEMERRYKLMASAGARELSAYNENSSKKIPSIVIFIDELADLMMVAKKNKEIDVENSICRLGQKARAAGIHLIVATQRPSVDVITGLIKSNMPSRVAFSTASSVDSKVILDEMGAEKLLGKGDGYFKTPKFSEMQRFKCSFIDGDRTKDIENIVNWWYENTQNNIGNNALGYINNSRKIPDFAAEDNIPILTDSDIDVFDFDNEIDDRLELNELDELDIYSQKISNISRKTDDVFKRYFANFVIKNGTRTRLPSRNVMIDEIDDLCKSRGVSGVSKSTIHNALQSFCKAENKWVEQRKDDNNKSFYIAIIPVKSAEDWLLNN